MESQKEHCLSYCQREKIQPVEIYEDAGFSAKTTSRPGLMAAVSHAKKKDVNIFLVYKLDRLSRNQLDYHTVRAMLAAKDTMLLSATETISDDPSGRFHESILSAVAQFDNEVRGQRTKDTMKKLALDGYWVNMAPLGYLNSRDEIGRPTMTINPAFGHKIAEAWNMALSGASIQMICDFFRRSGIRGMQGGKISKQSVYQMLINPVYAGYNKSKFTGGEYIQGKWPAIVDPKVFFQVVEIMTGKSYQPKQHKNDRSEFPLKKWVLCGKCERPLTASYSRGGAGKRYGYYHCYMRCKGINIAKDELEALFEAELSKLAWTPAFLEKAKHQVVAFHQREKIEVREERNMAERRLSKIKRRKDRLLDLFIDGKIPESDYDQKTEDLSLEMMDAQQELESLECKNIDISALIERVIKKIEHPVEWYKSVSYKKKRIICKLFFPKPPIYDGDTLRTTVIHEAVQPYGQDGSISNKWYPIYDKPRTLIAFLKAVDNVGVTP